MAVQAQHPSNAFSSDFRASFGVIPFDFKHITTTAAASDLTLNAPAPSKKRTRDQDPSAMAYHYHHHHHQAQPSTSGRVAGDDLVSQIIHHQSIEIDALIRLQNERLRLGLEEATKRQLRSVMAAFEQRLMKRLKEKEEELAAACRRNAELEEQIRQIAAENAIWFTVAKNNEAIVATLTASLEQVNNNAVSNGGVKEEEEKREGYGDSDGAPFGGDDDALSCCYGGREEGERRDDGAVRTGVWCKVCSKRYVSVLVLPCKHLCLCKDCESKTDTCPVCHASKNVCLQISFS